MTEEYEKQGKQEEHKNIIPVYRGQGSNGKEIIGNLCSGVDNKIYIIPNRIQSPNSGVIRTEVHEVQIETLGISFPALGMQVNNSPIFAGICANSIKGSDRIVFWENSIEYNLYMYMINATVKVILSNCNDLQDLDLYFPDWKNSTVVLPYSVSKKEHTEIFPEFIEPVQGCTYIRRFKEGSVEMISTKEGLEITEIINPDSLKKYFKNEVGEILDILYFEEK